MDLVRNVDASLQARRALSVDRTHGRLLCEAGDKSGGAELSGTGTRRKHVADGDVLDERGVDLGAVDDGLQDTGEKVASGGVLEATLAALGEGGTAGGSDDDLV